MILGLGFMAILKKALWGCHMANAGVNGLHDPFSAVPWSVGQLRRTASKEKEIVVMQEPQFCWRDVYWRDICWQDGEAF